MQLTLKRGTGTPLYQQIVDQIRDRIARGSLQPGDRLPTVRQLASDHRLTRLTVHSAYAELQADGLIESHGARGTFVSASVEGGAGSRSATPLSLTGRSRLTQILRSSDDRLVVSFAEAMAEPEFYPLQQIAVAAGRALESREALNYGPIQGDADLRREMSTLLLDRGVEVPSEAMLLTAGAQQGIDLVLRGLIGRRDVVLVEEPTYPGILEAVARAGQRMIGIPRGMAGLDMDALEAACRTHRPALLYVISTFGNPTGTSLPPEQCQSVLELARSYDFLILEDDVSGFLALDGPASPPLKSRDTEGRVIYLTSLSKVLAPSLRLGIIAASHAQLSAVADAKQATDMVCSMLLQRTAAEYLRLGQMRLHLEHVRALYRERRDAMLGALEQHLPDCTWTHPAGGLSLWVTLPENVDERDLIRDAMDQGVSVAPGRAFLAQPRQQAFIRLSYGMQTPKRIENGVTILGGVLQHHVAEQGVLSITGRAVGPLV